MWIDSDPFSKEKLKELGINADSRHNVLLDELLRQNAQFHLVYAKPVNKFSPNLSRKPCQTCQQNDAKPVNFYFCLL